MTEKRFSLQSFYPSVAPLKKEYFISDIENEYNSIYSLGNCVYVLNEQQNIIELLRRRLDYEIRMHNRWKNDCLAILEEQDLNNYIKKLQKSKKKSGWDSEPNTDYVTRVKEGLK